MSIRYVTRTVRVVALLWLWFPLSYLLYSTLALGLSIEDVVKLILGPWYWIVSAAAMAAGNGLRKLRWYGWYMFLVSNFMILYQTAVTLANYSHVQYKFLFFLATALIQSMVIYLVGRDIRVPYFFPRIRWWESDPRYKLSVPAKIIRHDGAELEGEIMDLSMGGCFLKTHAYFTPDEVVSLSFSLFDRPAACKGNVVWRAESGVTHPKGIGVKFQHLDKETHSSLKQAVNKLRKLARMYNQMSRERNWQEYLQREERFQGKTKP